MVKTVLVPLDGSALSETAIEPARRLAAGFDADLRLFTSTFALEPNDDQRRLERVAAAHSLSGASTEVSSGSSVAPAIVDAARSAPEALVCMATHGRSGIGIFLLGSVADEVVHDLAGPAVLIGPSYEPSAAGHEILVCVDGSPASASIVPTAVEWSRTLGLTPTFVTVRPTLAAEPEPDACTEPVHAAMARLRADKIMATQVSIVDDDAAHAIAEYAATHSVSYVAVATRGRGGVAPSALGGTAAKIIGQSPRPVLVCRSRN